MRLTRKTNPFDDFEPFSPCIGVCKVHPKHRICEGCYRTTDEIRLWRTMKRCERESVVRACAQRAYKIR